MLLSGTGFGNQGTVITPFSGSLKDGVASLLVQADDKLVAVGYSSGGGFGSPFPPTFSMARYTSTGTLDPTFGSGGKVTTVFPSNSTGEVPSAALEANQKILVVNGLNNTVSGVSSSVLAQYTTNGQLDPTFGTGGEVPVLAGVDSVEYVAVLPDGEIVVAGSLYNSGAKAEDFVADEYQANGALDTTFGTNGRVTTAVGPSGSLNGIAVQGDDIILVGSATTTDTPSTSNILVARYTAAGVLDTTFGTAGLASYPAAVNGSASGIAVGPGGSLFVAESSYSFSPRISYTTSVTSLTANGALDAAYGTGGTATTKGFRGSAIAVGSNGKAVVAGTIGFGELTKTGVAQFTATGAPDDSFGAAGLVTSAFTTSDTIDAVALQPATAGTRIVIAGTGFEPATGNDFLLARYTGSGVVDTSFGSGGISTTDFTGPVTASAQSIAPDGHGGTLVAGTAGSADGTLVVADYQADGALNPSFGNGGTVQVTFNSYIFPTGGGDIAIQKDGKILLVGTSIQPGSTNYDFAIARLLPDGKLDTSFGVGGKVTTFSGAIDTDMGATGGVVIQPDGKILVAGYTEDYGAQPDVDKGVVVRYNTNGSLDTTFGTGGRETFNLPGVYVGRVTGIALEPDGKIMIGGFSTSPVTHDEDYFLQKLYANGTPDTAFAPLGQIVTDFVAGGGQLLLKPNGKILVVGATFNPVTNQSYMTVAQFTAAGAPDLTYGTGGQASVGFPGNPNFTGVGLGGINFTLLPDGKVVVVSTYFVQDPTTFSTLSEQFALAQFTTAGKLDTTFGTGGTVLTSFGDGMVSAQAVQALSNGNLLIVGSSTDPATQLSDFALAEYASDGKLV